MTLANVPAGRPTPLVWHINDARFWFKKSSLVIARYRVSSPCLRRVAVFNAALRRISASLAWVVVSKLILQRFEPTLSSGCGITSKVPPKQVILIRRLGLVLEMKFALATSDLRQSRR